MDFEYSSFGEFFFWAFGWGFAFSLTLYVLILGFGFWIIRKHLPEALG